MVPISAGKWRPHTTGILLGGFVLILVALAASYMLGHFQPKTEVKLGGGVFQARLATTEAERTLGLSGVENLGANEGLLMVFDKAETHGIWMKDMKISIDILWLNKDKKVIYIVKNASPQTSTSETYRPKEPAMYVFEIPAGSVKSSAIKIGDKAVFSLEEEKQ